MELRVQAPALYRKGVLFSDVILKADLFCAVNKLLEAYRPKGPQYDQYPLCCAQMKVCPGNALGIGGKFHPPVSYGDFFETKPFQLAAQDAFKPEQAWST